MERLYKHDQSPETLGNVIGGVTWAGSNEENRSFHEAFTESLRTVAIPGRDKLHLRQRYIHMVKKYRRLRKSWQRFYWTSKVTVTLGSIIVPALITLDDEFEDRSVRSQAIYYVVFGISLIVSMTNGLQELFAVTKRFFTLATTEEALIQEGWSFLSLSGKYKVFEAHSDAFKAFANRIEKLHAGATNSTMALTREADDHQQDASSALQSNASEGAFSTGPPVIITER